MKKHVKPVREVGKSAPDSIIIEDVNKIASENLPWDRLKGKTILIAGASGFLPAYMVETLLFLNDEMDLGCRVLGLVRTIEKAKSRFHRYLSRSDFEMIHCDVSKGLPPLPQCDVVIHAASQASPVLFSRDPVGTMNANLLGTSQLLRLALEWNSEEFLFFSSGEVYGEVSHQQVPTREDDYGYLNISNPRSCYAESKRAAETLGISYAKQYGVSFKVVRPFHTYGPGMSLNDGRVFADFVRDIVSQQDIILNSDGSAVRAFCYVSDAVAGFFTVLLRGSSATAYNVGNPEGVMSIKELAELLVGMFPDRSTGIRQTRGSPSPEYLSSPITVNSPNVDRLKSLGWCPRLSVPDGFHRTILYYSLAPSPVF